MRTLLTVLMMICLSSCGSPQGESKSSSQGYVIVLLGAPGSGKGTQAVDLAKQLAIPHISLGDLLRYHKSNDTSLGRKAAEYMDKGLLVPDSLAIEVLAARVAEPDAKAGYILDGFPRTINQAVELDKGLIGSKRLVVVNLAVDDTALVKRLAGRGREDDTPEVVQQRLKVYQSQTAPLIDFYKKKGVLLEVDGGQSKDKGFTDIISALNSQVISSAK
jgi:adenylate kinase